MLCRALVVHASERMMRDDVRAWWGVLIVLWSWRGMGERGPELIGCKKEAKCVSVAVSESFLKLEVGTRSKLGQGSTRFNTRPGCTTDHEPYSTAPPQTPVGHVSVSWPQLALKDPPWSITSAMPLHNVPRQI